MGPRRIFAALAVSALAVLMVTAGVAVAHDFGAADPSAEHEHAGAAGEHFGARPPGDAGDPHGPADAPGDVVDGGAPQPAPGPAVDHGQGGPHGDDGHGAGGWDHGGTGQSDPGAGVSGQGGGSSAPWIPGPGVQGQGAGQGNSGDVNGADSGSSGSGGVTGSGTGTPPVPVEAPAAVASGPAPDATAAAPASAPTGDTFVAAGAPIGANGGAATGAVADASPAPVAPGAPSRFDGLGDLPVLGSIGSVAGRVTEGPSAAGRLLSTGTGRSLAVLGVLLAAIAVFLAVHRRTDRSDRKLAAARSGPDLSRFR